MDATLFLWNRSSDLLTYYKQKQKEYTNQPEDAWL